MIHDGTLYGLIQGQGQGRVALKVRNSSIFSSFHELMQSLGVLRPSVRLSVCLSVNFCANRFFYHRNGWIATKLAHDGPQKSLHPGVLMVKVKVKCQLCHVILAHL